MSHDQQGHTIKFTSWNKKSQLVNVATSTTEWSSSVHKLGDSHILHVVTECMNEVKRRDGKRGPSANDENEGDCAVTFTLLETSPPYIPTRKISVPKDHFEASMLAIDRREPIKDFSVAVMYSLNGGCRLVKLMHCVSKSQKLNDETSVGSKTWEYYKESAMNDDYMSMPWYKPLKVNVKKLLEKLREEQKA